MPHKLFISPDVRHNDTHRGHLQSYELVRGQPATIAFSVTNIGDEPFPGGTLASIVLYYGSGRQMSTEMTDRIPIKALLRQEQSEAGNTLQFVPFIDGHSWLTFRVEAADDEGVEYFQVIDEPPIGTTEWFGVFFRSESRATGHNRFVAASYR